MFAQDVHRILAYLSVLAMGLVAIEGGFRFALGRPAGRSASQVSGLILLLVGLTAAAGLAVFVSGHAPREVLHFVYAVLAFGMVPTADAVSTHWSQRQRALARGIGALLGLVVIWRLFSTG